jgi:hypothetical protein
VRWSLDADAIAVSGIREARAAGHFGGRIEDLQRIKGATTRVPVRDDSLLTDILQEWAIRRVEAEMPGYFANARVVVVGGTTRERTIAVLREFTDNIIFDEPGHDLVLPGQVKTNPVTATAAGIGEFAWRQVPGFVKDQAGALRLGQRQGRPRRRRGRRRHHRLVLRADALRPAEPRRQGGDHQHGLRGPARHAQRARRRPRRGRHARSPSTSSSSRRCTRRWSPPPCPPATSSRPTTSPGSSRTPSSNRGCCGPAGRRRKSRFSFVIHPLSTEYFKNVEPLGHITSIPGMSQVVEKTIAYVPPFVYSHVTGIVSDTGDEAEGWLITVGGTPKQMLAHPPEFTYSRLLEAAELSRRLGAQIMGLGAFTKVVGDAGVTVAKQAKLPVTTGNSYSASGALWAAHEAVRRLGIAEVDDDGTLHGKAMVVGASGAIGSACARLLALAADELWLVSPGDREAAPAQAGHRAGPPRAVVHVATDPSAALRRWT